MTELLIQCDDTDSLSRTLYNEDYHTVLCVACKQCMVPGEGIKRHLKDHHSSWPLHVRKEVIRYCSTLRLLQPTQILQPNRIEKAITGLATQAGWKCNACAYCCVSKSNMQEHNKQCHKWTTATGVQWRPATVQTLFGGPRRRFLEVESVVSKAAEKAKDFTSAIETLLEDGKKRDQEQVKLAAQAGDEQLPTDNTPWMRKTRWARKFAGRDLLAVAALCQKPSKDEGSLMLVWESVHRVLGRCRVSVVDWYDHEEDRDVVLGWLNSPQVDKCNPDPFSTYFERATHTKYTNWFAQGVGYCLRVLHAEDRHGHSFSVAEEEALRRIWETAELGSKDDTALDSSVFDLSVLFWTHEGRAHSKSTIIHFSAVFGIDNHKGCYRLPSIYGKILAALLYCARLLLFEHALPAAEREHIDDPCSCFLLEYSTLERRAFPSPHGLPPAWLLRPWNASRFSKHARVHSSFRRSRDPKSIVMATLTKTKRERTHEWNVLPERDIDRRLAALGLYWDKTAEAIICVPCTFALQTKG